MALTIRNDQDYGARPVSRLPGDCHGTLCFFVDALGKHPLCHRMCKVTKETSGTNKITRNAINSTSITFRWTSSSSRQSVFSTTTITNPDRQENRRKMAASRGRVIIW